MEMYHFHQKYILSSLNKKRRPVILWKSEESQTFFRNSGPELLQRRFNYQMDNRNWIGIHQSTSRSLFYIIITWFWSKQKVNLVQFWKLEENERSKKQILLYFRRLYWDDLLELICKKTWFMIRSKMIPESLKCKDIAQWFIVMIKVILQKGFR